MHGITSQKAAVLGPRFENFTYQQVSMTSKARLCNNGGVSVPETSHLVLCREVIARSGYTVCTEFRLFKLEVLCNISFSSWPKLCISQPANTLPQPTKLVPKVEAQSQRNQVGTCYIYPKSGCLSPNSSKWYHNTTSGWYQVPSHALW